MMLSTLSIPEGNRQLLRMNCLLYVCHLIHQQWKFTLYCHSIVLIRQVVVLDVNNVIALGRL